MKRKYPAKFFWLFVLTNFLFHFFYLFLPGLLLCIVGIWITSCLWIGLAILLVDLILSILEQMRIRKAAITPSDNQDFNAFMDAFCGPDGMTAVAKLAEEKIAAARSIESDKE